MKLDLRPVAEDIVRQLKSLVPVRTGRLKNSISYNIVQNGDDYFIQLIMEDYIKWLQYRSKPATLPTPRELALAAPPLPKMNDLKIKSVNELSERSRGIFGKIDYERSFDLLDLKTIEEEIDKIFVYDK